jgi:hypothetical protein
MIKKEIISAWRKAKDDLEIRIDPELALTLKDRTDTFLFIENFGGPNGTIAISADDTMDFKELTQMGFYCSALADSYSTYDRILFIDTLNDWGFYGDKEAVPNWYEGHIYSQ